jgi:hypothetical protein
MCSKKNQASLNSRWVTGIDLVPSSKWFHVWDQIF